MIGHFALAKAEAGEPAKNPHASSQEKQKTNTGRGIEGFYLNGVLAKAW